MTLSKNSLHYKMFKYVNGNKDQTSLCLWFWSVFVGAPLKFIFYGHIGTFPVMWAMNILLTGIATTVFSLSRLWDKPISILILPLIAMSLISTIIAIYKARRNYWSKLLTPEELNYWDKDFLLPERFRSKETPPGKVIQFFKLVLLTISAIKHKMCPIITLK